VRVRIRVCATDDRSDRSPSIESVVLRYTVVEMPMRSSLLRIGDDR